MSGLHPVDGVVLVSYLLGITALGVWMARRVHTADDFFMPRRFGKAMMITHAFGTGTASDQAVVVASQTFQSGLSGIWWQWLWLPATPFYWLIAPIMRRLRAVTTADVYTLRYDRSVAVLFAVVGVVGLSVKIGLLLKGSSELVDAGTGGLISANWAIAVIPLLFVVYGIAGGLGAAIVTDFVQGVLTIVFSFMLLPLVFRAVGGIAGIHETVQNPSMLSLLSPGEIGPFFVVMYAVQALVGIVAQPFIMGVCAAGRTETDGRVGFMVGNIVKRLCTIAWSLTALAAVAWYLDSKELFEITPDGPHGEVCSQVQPGKVVQVDLGAEKVYAFRVESHDAAQPNRFYASKVKPDFVYGNVARRFLPRIMPGLLGVFLASLLASVMSSCDSFMISSSGLLTENIYKPLRPGRSNRHYVAVARVASLAVVAGGIAFAYWVPNVRTALNIWLRIAPMMGITFWMGLLWRRGTVAGAWATTLTGFAAWFLTKVPAFVELVARLPMAQSLSVVWQTPGKPPEIYEPWTIVFYTSAATLVGIVVSLVTRPVAKEKLDRFYALTRTPIMPGEEITEPCTLPEGVEPPPRRMLLSRFGLEIPAPSRKSVVGFIAGWIAVAALIAGFVWIVGF